jgi:glutamine synthetase
MDKAAILELVKKENVRFVDMQFTDIHGTVKAVTIPVSKLQEVLDNNIWFDGSSIEGFTRVFESDMYLKPDLNTFAIIPWTKDTERTTARFICDVYLPNGELYDGSPRTVLINQLKKLDKLGLTFFVGPELEFFLFKKENSTIKSLPHDRGGYFDQSTDMATEIRQDMTSAMQAFNIDVEALHHEVAEGQHEIDFRYGEALTVADNAVTFKYIVKAIAHQHDLHATFMAKPLASVNGSGMHVHQSFFKADKNSFYDKNGLYHLSEMAQYYIGGQMKHAPAMTAILNPSVNSYKRLVPGYEAPIYITWATTNRSALIRIPRHTPGREASTRCELRSPDPMANPYLAFAVMLAAGLDGIKNKISPPKPMDENIYELSEANRKLRDIATLPETLKDALEELKNDTVIRSALNASTYENFYAGKMKEWLEYSSSVSEWELKKYLEIF